MPETTALLDNYGLVGGLIAAFFLTLLINAKPIGQFIIGLSDRLLQRRDLEDRRSAELEDLLVENGRQAKSKLLSLYEQLLVESRAERREMQEHLEVAQERQDRLHNVTLTTVEACTESIVRHSDRVEAFTAVTREQAEILAQIREAIVAQKTVQEQLGFALAQLIFLLSQEKGVPVSPAFIQDESQASVVPDASLGNREVRK